MGNNRALVERYVEALRQGDADAAAALFTEDAEYHFHVSSKPIVGRERLAKMLRAVVPHQQNSRLRLTAVAETDNGVLFEAIDEHDDDTTGRHVVLPYAGSYEMRDGLIWRARDYFDMGFYEAAKAGEPIAPWVTALADAST